MIKDCFGRIAQVGDEIAFSRGNAGAKEWEKATITRITPKTVMFSGKTGALHGLSSDLAADSSAAQIASLLFFAHRKGLLVVGRKEGELPQGQHGFYATHSTYFTSEGEFVSLRKLIHIHNCAYATPDKIVQTISLQYHKKLGKLLPQKNKKWVHFVEISNEKRIVPLSMGV